MAQSHDTDVIVAGAGPVGSLAALALAQAGFSVTLVGPKPREDRRTTALMNPALEFLDSAGIRKFAPDEAAALSTMRIVDATGRLVRSAPVTFRASEIGEERFGQNIPNSVLNAALEDAVADSSIRRDVSLVSDWRLAPDAVTATTDAGAIMRAMLVVAADGRASPARDAAGIKVRARDYRQTALVVNFGHERPHADTSTEFHTETGPFTQVPLPGRRSSLVWVVRPDTAAFLMALDDGALSLRIEERMQSMLGKVRVEPGRQTFPLSSAQPSSVARNRVALVGEAAHVFPPIGAQGMNLGIRDVADLIQIVRLHRQDPGSEEALAAYRAARRADIAARSGAVDLLNRTLLSDFLPAQVARSAGLGLLGSVGPLRGLFMREGMRPGSGLRSMLSAARKQIGRKQA